MLIVRLGLIKKVNFKIHLELRRRKQITKERNKKKVSLFSFIYNKLMENFRK